MFAGLRFRVCQVEVSCLPGSGFALARLRFRVCQVEVSCLLG